MLRPRPRPRTPLLLRRLLLIQELSLLLRQAGDSAENKTRKITLNDLGGNEPINSDKVQTATVVVTRATAKQDYTVPVEGSRGDMTTGQNVGVR